MKKINFFFFLINIMASQSRPKKISAGAFKLCQDIATLFNNPIESDIQFKVTGPQDSDGKSTSVTIYAHSLILRCRSKYFANMMAKYKHWREDPDLLNLFFKHNNISFDTMNHVFKYIYSGEFCVKDSEHIIELIAVANEFGIEEIAEECQSEFMRAIKYIFSDKYENSATQQISVDTVVRKHIIPVLNHANDHHSLLPLSQELLKIMVPRISVITKIPETYTIFTNGISGEALLKIIESKDLVLPERSVWDLALSWGCHQTQLSKTAVEAQLSILDDDDEKDDERFSDEVIAKDTKINQLKKILKPFLPSIRFDRLDSEDYLGLTGILSCLLPRRQFVKINRFFFRKKPSDDAPKEKPTQQQKKTAVSDIIETKMWRFLKENIIHTGGMFGCYFPEDLKFELLFQASKHDFHALAFHHFCDNSGPTLVIVRSVDGHLFGGVNFNDWKSDFSYSSSTASFLFALPDGNHRKDYAMFRPANHFMGKESCFNNPYWGPCFGVGIDLAIADLANINEKSYSGLPMTYVGNGASPTALAGEHNFRIAEYYVFRIYSYSSFFYS